MGRLGPFEEQPNLAVGCSGGADSTALTIMLHRWARRRGGILTALIVDHGLRSDSAAEAKTVAKRLSNLHIPQSILSYRGTPFLGDIQSAARQTRYELLTEWCADNDCLHLFVAHHLEDQAETVLLRLARGSGIDGLAAMAPVTEGRNTRILRPLLSVSRVRLRATLSEHRMTHVEDPSNDNVVFARVRMRALQAGLSGEGMTPRRLAATAARHARARSAIEGDIAMLLARSAILYPQGYGSLVPEALKNAPEEIGLRALSRVVTCVSGGIYPPRLDRIERLYDWIRNDMPSRGRTIAGCRVLKRGSTLLICREPSAANDRIPARGEAFWDGRFRLRFGKRATGEIRRLGQEGWREAVSIAPTLRQTPIPAAVRPSLPAIWSENGLNAVPHLDFYNREATCRPSRKTSICFTPRQPLLPARFTLQKGRYTLSN